METPLTSSFSSVYGTANLQSGDSFNEMLLVKRAEPHCGEAFGLPAKLSPNQFES
jgi:hypothetical protein